MFEGEYKNENKWDGKVRDMIIIIILLFMN